MKVFRVLYSGDYFDVNGNFVLPGAGFDLLENDPSIETGIMREQSPQPGETAYSDRRYSLEVTPRHVASANGIVICRPWVKPSAFAHGAENLVAIGRAGAGYDKIDLAACTANDVLVFNCPNTLVHPPLCGADLDPGAGKTPS